MKDDPANSMVRLLARREYSSIELERRLINRFPMLSKNDRRQLLLGLKSKNLQSDDRFCAMLVRTRLAQGVGRRKIEQELLFHGIQLEQINRELKEANSSEKDRAVVALEKWFRTKKNPNQEKALRYLAGRGFSLPDATEAVNSIFR